MSATLLKSQHAARPDDLARDSPESLDPQHGAHPASRSWGDFAQAYLGPFWRRFTLLGVFLVVSTLLQTLGPQLAQRFIDAQRAHAVETALLALAIGAVVAAVFNALFGVGAAFLGQDIGWASTNRIREDLAGWLLRQDMSFHNLRTPGELIERIDGDLTTLSDTFSVLLIQVVGGALLMVGTLIALFLANWVMGLVLTAFALVALVALLIMRSVAVPAGVNEREASAQFLGFLEERLAGVEDLRANGAGAYVMRRFYQAARVWFRKSVVAWTRRVSVFVVTLLIFGLGLGLTMGMSAYLYLVAHSITIGVVYLFVQYMFLLQGPIEQISQQMQQFQKAASSLIRVRELLSLQSSIVDGQTQLPAGASGDANAAQTDTGDERRGLGVSFDHVTFTYPTGEQPTLHDVSFALEPGQVMGLVGRTGSGKTTISRLLFRLYDVGEGAVRLDGVDVRDLPLATLHQHVGLVTQDVQLFQASVRDNVTFFDDSIPDERIIAVFERLGMGEWLARLPDGLSTWLEASGGGLSAGEAQLLAFVRVFLRDPGLVILDEPSSRLDLATERMIEQGMRALLAGRTGIIIAHRLATVRRADVILTLGGGRVLELGEREALERQPDSHFAALLRVGLEDEDTIDQDQEGALV
ncbi:MAG TPA: ABC transporter ATP-binding protein [Ktedonobacterales bacterium]|nr:ABC transporter ATP-binding protein [Ktedonobacterales bacterium]